MKDHSMHHMLQIIGVNLAAFGITLSNVEEWMKIISLSIAILYSVWKFSTDYKDRQDKKKRE